MAHYNGYNTRIQLDENNIPVTKWSCKPRSNSENTTNTEGSGFEEHEGTVVGMDVSIEGKFDPDENPFTNAPTIYEGSVVAAKLYLHKTDANKLWDLTGLLIEDISFDADANGKVNWSLTGKSTGSYTRPA